MTIDLNTLIQVILANEQGALLLKTLELQANVTKDVPTYVTIGVHNDDLPVGKIFEGSSRYGTVQCPVIKAHEYRIGDVYDVILPNGNTRTVVIGEGKRSNILSTIVDKERSELADGF